MLSEDFFEGANHEVVVVPGASLNSQCSTEDHQGNVCDVRAEKEIADGDAGDEYTHKMHEKVRENTAVEGIFCHLFEG